VAAVSRGVSVRGPVFRIGLVPALLLGLGRVLGRVLGWAVRAAWAHPGAATALGGVAALAAAFAWLDGALVASVCLGVAGVAGALAWLAPERWAGWVAGPVRARWLRTRVYGRTWERDMTALKLDRGDYLPGLLRVTPEEGGDRLRVRLAPGSLAEDWDAVRQRIASTYDARLVRIRRVAGSPSQIDVHVRYAAPAHGAAPEDGDDTPQTAFPREAAP
jgi:hypothetical protein